YYVNSTPHIGHAYTTIIGDILVRHQRQRGVETFFLTGVDEHADKVARVAAEQGLTPREFTDGIVGHWRDLTRRVNASSDYFIRKRDEDHQAPVSSERGPKVRRGRPARLQHQPRDAEVGHPAPVGREPGRLRLGRRARQLPQRAHVRVAGRGPAAEVLARGAPPAGEGHPP